MISVAVWLSSNEAKVFKFTPEGVESHQLHSHGKSHPKETSGKNHTIKGGDEEHFLHEVAEFLTKDNSGRWLVMGPGLAKNHFKSHVESHHKAHANKIYAVEAMDKATDGEIVKFAHEYFKKHGVFE